jgi:hypothetical protein
MAIQTVPMDDTGMLADLMSDAPEQEAPQVEVAPPPEQEPPKVDERPRDEQGRFAPKQPEPEVKAEAPTTEQPEPKDEEGRVPSWRLRELREAREAAERRAEEASRQNYAFQEQMRTLQRRLDELQKPKQEPVDFFTNPDAAIEQRLTPMQQEFQRVQSQALLNSSEALAIAEYGKDAVREMKAAIDAAVKSNHPDMDSLRARMQHSDHPVAVAMEWHQQKMLQAETGGDLKAYRQKLREELKKDPAFVAELLGETRTQLQSAPNARPNIQLPKSLNSVAGTGLSSDVDDNDMSDAGLFRQAMSAPRR